jgi:hypothetical protein
LFYQDASSPLGFGAGPVRAVKRSDLVGRTLQVAPQRPL